MLHDSTSDRHSAGGLVAARAALPPLTLTSVVLLLLAGCGGGSEHLPGEGPIKIGAIFDLTGPTSDVGTTYSEGIRDHVEWVNRNGGIGGRPVELLFQDYGYKVDQAEQLYSQFVQEGVVAFMGWGTGDTEALRGRIADDEIPFMSASYSHVLGNPAEAPYNFLAGTSYTDQLHILLDWIVEQEGGEAPEIVAVMHNPSPFGLSPIEQGGREYAASLGIDLLASEMARGSTDYTAELTRIAEAGARWIVFQNTSAPAALAIKNGREMASELSFACLNWCTNEVLVALAGKAAEGVVGSVIYAPPGDDVVGLEAAEAFLAAQGSSLEEKGLLYGQGWWTMALMLEGVRRAAEEGEVTGAAIKEALESMRSFPTGGVTAPVTFTPEDHRGIKGMRIFEVRDGRWQPLGGLRTAGD